MHQTYRTSSFANGGSHPLDAPSADVAYSENSREAALQYVRRTGEWPGRISIWVDRQWQIASGQDEALVIKCETASQPVGVGRGAGHYEEVVGRCRTYVPGLLVDPPHFFDVV